MVREGRARRESLAPAQGQVFPLAAIMFLVLFGFAGLALDAGHLYLVQRGAQNAADAAALPAGKRLSTALQTGPPAAGASTTNPALQSAHDLAGANGFATVRSAACDAVVFGSPQAGLNQFTTSWYDTGGPCGTTSYTTAVTVYTPPQTLTDNCGPSPYNCMQVLVTQQVHNYLLGVLGEPVITVTASATVYAEPPKGAFSLPPSLALYLYQPGSKQGGGCPAIGQQCFDESQPPQRALLTCSGAQNCPTFWVRPGSNPMIAGIDGSTLSPPNDTVAVESNGDAVLQDATTICDPNGGASCTAGVVTGLKGLAMAGGSKLYCSGFDPSSVSSTTPPCTTTGQAPLGTLYTNETGFAVQSWTPTVNTAGLPACGGLILNGGPVDNTAFPLIPPADPAKCIPGAANAYTIQPGKYNYVVINHGQYDLEGGLYEITGTAPVNSRVSGLANGIDHSGETPADWDLCTTAPQPPNPPDPLACSAPALTASVWIGHGTLGFTAAAGGFAIGNCEDGNPQIGQIGGGDKTQVTGTGVSFLFDGPPAAGFVSTHEVDFISMVAPATGQLPRVGGVPLLFNLQNDTFIHLDAAGTSTQSQFRGIIFQSMTAKGGGVEVNPGLAGGTRAAIGQVWAYSFTTFGSAGLALDFSKGFGSSSSPPLGTSGEEEQEILQGATLVPGPPGFESLVMRYSDEWKLDAFTAYVRINNGPPTFFSEGIWNGPLGAGQTPPPTNNNPGDAFPAVPAPAQDPGNKYAKAVPSPPQPDWTMSWADGSTFEIQGDWVWGHEQSISGANDGENAATLTYTFPIPAGKQVTVTMFMADGDSCGDFALATVTFTNVVPPSPGQQSVGTVRLEQ